MKWSFAERERKRTTYDDNDGEEDKGRGAKGGRKKNCENWILDKHAHTEGERPRKSNRIWSKDVEATIIMRYRL